MSDTVIEFKNVTKVYKLFKSDRQRLKAVFSKKAAGKKKVAVDNLSQSNVLFGCKSVKPETEKFQVFYLNRSSTSSEIYFSFLIRNFSTNFDK